MCSYAKDQRDATEIVSLVRRAVDGMKSELEQSLPKVGQRLGRFESTFDHTFPRVGGRREGEERGMAEALTWALLQIPLYLYAIELNGAAIMELHGVLERFAARETTKFLEASKKKGQVLYSILGRQSLSILALLLVKLGMWDKEDLKFVEHLTTLRNGTAHKNPRVISNILLGGSKLSYLDIDATLSKVDVLPLLIRSIQILNKLVRGGQPTLKVKARTRDLGLLPNVTQASLGTTDTIEARTYSTKSKIDALQSLHRKSAG